MKPIGNKIATINGFVDLYEVLEIYHKAKDLEKENAELKEEMEDLRTAIAPLTVEQWREYAKKNAELKGLLKAAHETIDEQVTEILKLKEMVEKKWHNWLDG